MELNFYLETEGFIITLSSHVGQQHVTWTDWGDSISVSVSASD